MTGRRRVLWAAGAVLLAAVLIAGLWAASYLHMFPQRAYTAEDFGIETVRGEVDFNGNGVDDYTDLLLGARRDGENRPRYDGAYWEGRTWIIHNGGQSRREEDYLGRGTVTGHYRFDASRVDPDLLIPWEN